MLIQIKVRSMQPPAHPLNLYQGAQSFVLLLIYRNAQRPRFLKHFGANEGAGHGSPSTGCP